MHGWITFLLLCATSSALSTDNVDRDREDTHIYVSTAIIDELRTMFHEIKQELREERTARIQQQKQMEAQWKTELKHVTDSCMASTVALEERMKRGRPEIQNEYNAWGCAFETITLTCPTGTILVTNAQYGMYDTPCSDGCCTPDTTNDCSEHVILNTPSDWTNLKALCDGKTSCAYEYNGRVIDACQAGYVADYMQVFFDCQSEIEPVGFTAHATETRQYDPNEIILFDDVQSNFGGHYDSTTCTFTCPHHGIYQFSVNFNAFDDNYMYIEIVRDGTVLGEGVAHNTDSVSGLYNHANAFVIVECDENEKVWARCSGYGYLWVYPKYSQFSGYLIHRYA